MHFWKRTISLKYSNYLRVILQDDSGFSVFFKSKNRDVLFSHKTTDLEIKL